MKKFKFKWKSTYVLLLSMALGCILGIFCKNFVSVIKPLGDIFINLLFTIVVPLVFCLISSSISKFGSGKKFGKIVVTTLIVFLTTSLISSIFMFGTLSLVKPTIANTIPNEIVEIENVTITEKIVDALTVSDFSELLSRQHLLPLILFATLFGFGVAFSKEKGEPVKNFLESATDALLKMIDIIMYYAPIGICAYFANLIKEMGPELIGTYASYLIVYLVTCLIYFFFFYSFYAFLGRGKKGIKEMWKAILSPSLTSLATCSSVATLPVNMESAKKLNVKKEISGVSLSLGATVHMEGSSMGTVLKIMFLFSIFGKNFYTLPVILITLLLATFICMAMSGIPSGGLISEILILSIFGFPTSAYVILTTLAWLIDAPATCLNATGDIPSVMMIEKMVKDKVKMPR